MLQTRFKLVQTAAQALDDHENSKMATFNEYDHHTLPDKSGTITRDEVQFESLGKTHRV